MVKKKSGSPKAPSTTRKPTGDRPVQKNRKPLGQGGKGGRPAFTKPSKAAEPKRDGTRLNKFIANSGVCSRREADTYIASGLVTVNNKVVNTMGYLVQSGDEVKFDGRRLQQDPPAYVLLNKPKSVASTTSESKGLTVMDLIANATNARVAPVGRLGRNATGLFLFTNDDRLMQKLHKKGLPRLFHVELSKNLKNEDLLKIREGQSVDGRTVVVEEISYVANAAKKEVGLRIKNMGSSIIRELFEHLGYQVVKVDCVALAHLTKKDLPRGRYRHLNDDEISLFSML
ncbi:S4 domain-containing protein [Flavobacteriaceae bacterium]|jgi:23S rRNA pseudouridine2605 synthase|nr:S4 domain-containing protein [Flavobacteriaceae bacterium]